LISYHHSTNLVLADGNGVPIHRHIYFSDIRNYWVSTTLQVPAGLGDDILAGALEVKVVTIKCVVVGVTPGPAYACVLGDAHSFTLLNMALLFDPALDWLMSNTGKSMLLWVSASVTLTLKSYNLYMTVYGMTFLY
uniref:Uncharacterized protein n=1 Tax=Sander lucioperca TaxID=283035 RepID=A0A8C9ZTQ8_SANLU